MWFSTIFTVFMWFFILVPPLYTLWILLVSKSFTEKTRQLLVAAVMAGLIWDGFFGFVMILNKAYSDAIIFLPPILVLIICRILFEHRYKLSEAKEPTESE